MLCVLWSAFILSKGDIFICHSHLKEFFEAAFRHSIQFIIGFNWDQERYLWPDYYFSKSKMRLQGDVFKHCVTTQKTSVIVKVLQKTYIFVKGKNVTHLGANRDQLNLTNPLEWHRAFFSVRETPPFQLIAHEPIFSPNVINYGICCCCCMSLIVDMCEFNTVCWMRRVLDSQQHNSNPCYFIFKSTVNQ